jgi:spore coat polysaccharide biosynthesis protein SpsF
VVVQARMTSTRLPGKVLMDVAGAPMLAQQLRRLRRCRALDDIVVATTTNATDDPLVRLADAEGVRWYRGSEHDVLGRYAAAAREAGAELVVRSTADCPLIDPGIVDLVVTTLAEHADDTDYASNVVRRTHPQGLDVEALFGDVLARLDRMARSAPAREHVTYFVLRERPELFAVRAVAESDDSSTYRWTVDTPEDLAFVRRIYESLDVAGRAPAWRDMVDWCRANDLGRHAPAPGAPADRAVGHGRG